MLDLFYRQLSHVLKKTNLKQAGRFLIVLGAFRFISGVFPECKMQTQSF